MYALAKSKKANTACIHQPCNHMLSVRFFISATTACLRICSLKNFSLKTTGTEPQIFIGFDGSEHQGNAGGCAGGGVSSAQKNL
jgi:hypothetical protein